MREQDPGDRQGLASDAAEQVVMALVVAPAPRAQPTGDGAAAAGKEQPGAECDEPHLLAGVERPGQGGDPDDERDRQPLRLHPRLSFASVSGLPNPACGESRLIGGPSDARDANELPEFWESAAQGQRVSKKAGVDVPDHKFNCGSGIEHMESSTAYVRACCPAHARQ